MLLDRSPDKQSPVGLVDPLLHRHRVRSVLPPSRGMEVHGFGFQWE